MVLTQQRSSQWPVSSLDRALTFFFHGYHVYCREWTPAVGEDLFLKQEPDNCRDKFAVAILRNGRVVGHIPKTVSRTVYFFLNRDGHSGLCEVTARLTNCGVDLGVEVSCVYRFYGCWLHIETYPLNCFVKVPGVGHVKYHLSQTVTFIVKIIFLTLSRASPCYAWNANCSLGNGMVAEVSRPWLAEPSTRQDSTIKIITERAFHLLMP